MDINTIMARLKHTEQKELYRDSILGRAGVAARGLHPTAAQIAEEDVPLLSGLAQTCSEVGNVGRSASVPVNVWSTPDFNSELSGILTTLAIPGFQMNVWHRKICDLRTAPNYYEHEFAQTLLYPEMGYIPEGGEPKGMVGTDTVGSISARLHDYGTDVLITRQALVNDDIPLLARMAKNIGAAAMRKEAQMVFGLLENNPQLSDGAAMFSSGAGNLYEQPLDDANLGIAIGMLRNMPLVGEEKVDLAAKFLVVSPALEYTALKLVHDAGLGIEVGASAWLAPTRWYLFADPVAAPTIALFHLPGAANKVMFSKTEGKRKAGSDTFTEYFPRDGSTFGARFSFGVAQTGRFAIRGGSP